MIIIDEYYQPITENFSNLKKCQEMREAMNNFYRLFKSLDEVKINFFQINCVNIKKFYI